jgi:TonB family protein
MFRRSLSIAACAVLTIQAAPLSAAQPLGEWKLEPSDARCVAARQYGTPDKPITLAVKDPPSYDTLQLAIIRTGFRKGTIQTTATLRIDEVSFDASALSYPLAGKAKRVAHLINLDAVQATALRTGTSLKISVLEGIDGEFSLREMSAIWNGLAECKKRLVEKWNFEAEARLASGPKGDLQAIISADDYPRTAQRGNQQGKGKYLILIDEMGMVRDCTLLVSSGFALLDSRACGVIMQRARFMPALDHSGKPAKSALSQVINWRLQ